MKVTRMLLLVPVVAAMTMMYGCSKPESSAEVSRDVNEARQEAAADVADAQMDAAENAAEAQRGMADSRAGMSEAIRLSHVDPNKTSATYNHAEYIEQRRRMMQDWADRLDLLERGQVEAASAVLTVQLEQSRG